MQVYGFFYNGMIYESDAALISLHTTKAGAWRALRRYIFKKAQDDRDYYLDCKYIKNSRGSKGMMSWAAWYVEAVEVKDD